MFETDEMADILGLDNNALNKKIKYYLKRLGKLGPIEPIQKIVTTTRNGIRDRRRKTFYRINTQQCEVLIEILKLDLTESQVRWLVSRGITPEQREFTPLTKTITDEQPRVSTVALSIALEKPHFPVINFVLKKRKALEYLAGDAFEFYSTSTTKCTNSGRTQTIYYPRVVDLTSQQAIEVIKGLNVLPLSLNRKLALEKLGIDTSLLPKVKPRVRELKYSSHDQLSKEEMERLYPKNPELEERERLIELCEQLGYELNFFPRYVTVESHGKTIFIGAIPKAIKTLQAWDRVPLSLKEKATAWAGGLKSKIGVKNADATK